MIEKITEYILNTDGALFQLVISLIVFAVSYLISRLVRHKIMPWLMNLLNKKEKKGPYVLAKGFSRPAPVAVWTTGIFLACALLPLPADLGGALTSLMSKLLRVTMICLLAWGLIGMLWQERKIDFRKGLQGGQQVNDMQQHKNRPAVLISLQSACLLKGQKRDSQHQASRVIMKSSC